MAFHMVCSFLLPVLASETTLWMAWIFQQPIGCFYFMVSGANTRIKKEDTTWMAMKSWARKCYNFLCTINFEVTWPFWKMWYAILFEVNFLISRVSFFWPEYCLFAVPGHTRSRMSLERVARSDLTLKKSTSWPKNCQSKSPQTKHSQSSDLS